MAKYIIHACPQREWYVNDYLIPSMYKQGIAFEDISVYMDKDNLGCLESCMSAFASVPDDDNGTWHLQDDIVLCSNFKEVTELIDDVQDYDIACGYCFEKDVHADKIGEVNAVHMWYSFPCIYISNKIAKACAEWFYNYVIHENCYGVYVRSKKHDDTLFHIFMEDYYPHARIINLFPNLVDHIDYLIGGSVINGIRPDKETHARYFEDIHELLAITAQLIDDENISE